MNPEKTEDIYEADRIILEARLLRLLFHHCLHSMEEVVDSPDAKKKSMEILTKNPIPNSIFRRPSADTPIAIAELKKYCLILAKEFGDSSKNPFDYKRDLADLITEFYEILKLQIFA